MAPSSSSSEAAIRAALNGDIPRLKEMARTMDLRKARGRKGWNLLHFAAFKGHLDLCRFLVEEAGFHANSTSAEGETPVLAATELPAGGDEAAAAAAAVPVLRYLLDRGSDPAAPDAKGYTPLHNAAEFGICDAVRLLLSRGVPVDPVNRRGAPLHVAAARGQDQTLRILLEHGADPNRVLNHLPSPLMMACFSHSLECMRLLVEAGADVNNRKPSGRPVIFQAVEEDLKDILKFLLEAGADPNIHDGDQIIPIMTAAADGKRELVEILLPRTKPIPYVPDWSVDGIIRAMKNVQLEPQASGEERLADAKLRGNQAFAKGDYATASYLYLLAMTIDPQDATVFANRSLCWLRLREGEFALADARQCRTLRPRWPKGWYREGVALSMLRDFQGAVDAFKEALKLDPTNEEIKKALREAMEALNEEQKP